MMKTFIIFIVAILFTGASIAGPPQQNLSELQNVSFITEAFGFSGTVLNPAGLARRPNDDGAFLNYNLAKNGKRNETNFNFSMGNLSFGMQEFLLDDKDTTPLLKYYRVGMAIGGRVFSIGTSNKLIELEYPHHASRVFSVDAGFVFQPVDWFTLAGFGRDLDEPEIEDIQFSREYVSGISVNLFDQRVRLLGQALWNDRIRYLENAKFKVGLSFSPIENSNIVIGAMQNPDADEEFFSMLQFPIWGGIRLTAAARFNEKGIVQKYYSAVYIPLRTISF